MKLVAVECHPQRSNCFDQVDLYRQPRYRIAADRSQSLRVTVYACLASGVRFTSGSAEIRGDGLYLECQTLASDTLAFELEPWEIHYSLTLVGELALSAFYFQGETLSELDDQPSTESGDSSVIPEPPAPD